MDDPATSPPNSPLAMGLQNPQLRSLFLDEPTPQDDPSSSSKKPQQDLDARRPLPNVPPPTEQPPQKKKQQSSHTFQQGSSSSGSVTNGSAPPSSSSSSSSPFPSLLILQEENLLGDTNDTTSGTSASVASLLALLVLALAKVVGAGVDEGALVGAISARRPPLIERRGAARPWVLMGGWGRGSTSGALELTCSTNFANAADDPPCQDALLVIRPFLVPIRPLRPRNSGYAR